MISQELIRRYLAGKCTPEEAARIREWYNSFEQEPDLMDALSAEERAALKEAMYREILYRLDTYKALPRPALLSRKTGLFILSGAAAVFLLFIGLRIIFDSPADPAAASYSGIKNKAEGAAGLERALPQGAEEIIVENNCKTIRRETLSDGSVVWLQPDTWISFPSVFPADKREVKMSGEAFFEVSHDASRPFTIFSGDLVTRVLGTSFNIKAYENAAAAEVSVFTGQVSVSLPGRLREAGSEALLLVKDEKAVFLQSEKLLTKQTYSAKKQPELNIWKKNTISFNNTPVREVVKVLNAQFNVSLNVADTDRELNNYILKADFTNQNLPDILQMLEKSLNLTYEIEGKEIVLKLDR